MLSLNKIEYRIIALFSLYILGVTTMYCYGKEKVNSDGNTTDNMPIRHEVRIGWGDMLFETMAFHDSPHHQWNQQNGLSASYLQEEKQQHRYTGHIFAEYQYYCLDWLSVGLQADFEGIFWKESNYDRYHNQVGETKDCKNYNLSLLPTIRFTYFRSKWVNLYSGLGIGMNVAFDNEQNRKAAISLNLNLLGMQVGNEHWFGAVELGLLNSLRNTNEIYMAGSRLFSVSAGYRF